MLSSIDHTFGCCSLLPNLITKFGWNPGRKIERWFRQRFHELKVEANVTFSKVFNRYLCYTLKLSLQFCYSLL